MTDEGKGNEKLKKWKPLLGSENDQSQPNISTQKRQSADVLLQTQMEMVSWNIYKHR
jgi:hypothetical protein